MRGFLAGAVAACALIAATGADAQTYRIEQFTPS